jgi:hypothetical protein
MLSGCSRKKEIKAKRCSRNYGNKIGNLAQHKAHPVIEQVNFEISSLRFESAWKIPTQVQLQLS